MSVPVLTSRMNAFIQPDDFTTGDRRVSRRILRPTAENEAPLKSTILNQLESTKATMDVTSSAAVRHRPGARDSQVPLGPRAPDFASRRITSEASALFPPTVHRTLAPNATSEPFLGLSARRNTSNFEFRTPPNLRNNGFANTRKLGSPSHQDSDLVIQNATSNLYQSDGVPRPCGRNPKSSLDGSDLPVIHRKFADGTTKDYIAKLHVPGISPVRQRNSALRSAQLSTTSPSGTPTITPLSIKTTRRQTQFPTAPSTGSLVQQPRKPIDPALVLTSKNEKIVADISFRPKLLTLPADGAISVARGFSNTREKDYLYRGPTSIAGSDGRSIIQDSYLKSQSLQHGQRLQQPQTAIPYIVTQDEMAYSSVKSHSPTRPLVQRTTTPLSSATKRQSGGSHLGGLGARTISPTDTRRLKRLSAANLAPPMPARSPTPELTFGDRPEVFYSPPSTRQRSVTPSSSHGTPDGIQRVGSGRALSSRSSYSSLRPPSSSLQNRPSFGSSGSKNSTTKSGNVHSSAGVEAEVVPPVPAIPKAYESPHESTERPFFSEATSSAIALPIPSADQLPTEKSMTMVEPVDDAVSVPPEGWYRRSFTMGVGKPHTSQSVVKQTSQPARLPPLNLLPLSDPTAAKIASFSRRLPDLSNGKLTPPPKRPNVRTPSTPMTASKATFSSYELQCSSDLTSFHQIRSSASYADMEPTLSTLEGMRSISPVAIASVTPTMASRGIVTHSGSLAAARNSIELQSARLRDDIQHLPNGAQLDSRASRLMGLRNRALSRLGKEPNVTQNPTSNEAEAPPAGISLRRKLSLGWRRSSSKASHSHDQHDEESPIQTPQSERMPPPKMPASTTWLNSNRLGPNTSSRVPSKHTVLSGQTSLDDIGPSANRTHNVPNVQLQTTVVTKTSSSILTPMHKILNSRSSHRNLEVQQSNLKLDRNDLAAEDEMKKLASKQKDVEAAVKELDELRRRASPKERVSPDQAARMASLNIFERGEIVDYPNIYFCGLRNAKKFTGDLAMQSANFGYDDERGDYNLVMGDHLAYRYEVVDMLGKGSFGQVVRCIDHKNGSLVAVKIIRNKKRFHQQALVEVNILQRLREWDPQDEHSMITFTQSFYFRSHLCISTELLGANLYEFIKTHDFRGFSLKLIRRFAKQMLASLCLLQSRNVIHCDLKPENILLSHPLHSEIKVIDFGSSCFENEKVYTYIQSRFYRSPEVILGMNYGLPIDMWSLGCILAELLTGYPIFPGENELEQLACIMEVFGPPEKHLIERSSRKKLFFDSLGKPRVTVSSKGKRRRPSSKTLAQALKCDDETFLDFIARCLRWDPDRRMKPDQAILHDFVTGAKTPSRTQSQNTSSVTASPAKRLTSAQTPSRTRPLPEPPASSYKSGLAVGSRKLPSSSPVKTGATSRRHSIMIDSQTSTGPRRMSNGTAVGTTVPHRIAVNQRSISGKPDLASAAAIASLQRQR